MLQPNSTQPGTDQPPDAKALWNHAVDASQLADGIRTLVHMAAEGYHHQENVEVGYCVEAIARLLDPLCEVLSEQLCGGLVGHAADASRAKKEGQS